IVNPAGGDEVPAPKAKEKEKEKAPPRDSVQQPPRKGDVLFVAQLVDPRESKKEEKKSGDNRPGDVNKPVNITAVGNQLIITSEDPDAPKLVQELVRLLTQTAPGEGDFNVIHLKNASAVQAAEVLDEIFNGPKQKNQFGGGAGGRGGGGGRGGFGGGGFGG